MKKLKQVLLFMVLFALHFRPFVYTRNGTKCVYSGKINTITIHLFGKELRNGDTEQKWRPFRRFNYSTSYSQAKCFFCLHQPIFVLRDSYLNKKNKMGLAWPQFCGCFMSCRLWNKRKSDIVSCQFYSIFSLEGGTDDNTEEEASDLDHGTVSWWCPGPEFPLLFFYRCRKIHHSGSKNRHSESLKDQVCLHGR